MSQIDCLENICNGSNPSSAIMSPERPKRGEHNCPDLMTPVMSNNSTMRFVEDDNSPRSIIPSQSDPQDPAFLAFPVELDPGRLHFSFSGKSPFQRSISYNGNSNKVAFAPTVEEDVAPSFPFATPVLRPLPPASPSHGHPLMPSPPSVARQYLSPEREAHGVKDMADRNDLDAIFKKFPSSKNNSTNTGSMLRQARTFDYGDDDGSEAREEWQLTRPVSMDNRIPSIRLANRLDSRDCNYRDHLRMFQDDDDDLTDEDSIGTYHGDDEDDNHGDGGSDRWTTMMRRLQLIEERVDRISIGNNSKHNNVRMAGGDTCIFSSKPSSSIGGGAREEEAEPGNPSSSAQEDRRCSSPLSLFAATAFENNFKDNHDTGAQQRRRRRRHEEDDAVESSKNSSALEWIQDLQNQRPTEQFPPIAEAASSKFLTKKVGTKGTATGTSAIRGDVADSEDIAKALGMPHPLCRSTTITGQYLR